MKKILGEIAKLIILYIIACIYGYFNTPLKVHIWWVSAILVAVFYGIFKLSEYLYKKKKNSKKEPPQLKK